MANVTIVRSTAEVVDFQELGVLKGLEATNSLAVAREDRGDIRRGGDG